MLQAAATVAAVAVDDVIEVPAIVAVPGAALPPSTDTADHPCDIWRARIDAHCAVDSVSKVTVNVEVAPSIVTKPPVSLTAVLATVLAVHVLGSRPAYFNTLVKLTPP